MYGYIPDARSAYFDIWRDYDEDRISDVSYFLKLNHSRLIVASLRWRPELKQNIKVHISYRIRTRSGSSFYQMLFYL